MRYNLPDIPPPTLIRSLRQFDLLPAIVFVPSRRKCDEYATEVALDKTLAGDSARRERRKQMFDQHAEENPEVLRHRHRRILVNSGIASHHAGHLPSWKLIVEKMMSAGLLNAIFATSTVAAGVDFPARTVVVSNSETRGDDGWRSLSASELQQMTGRAGRRGKDNVGFILLAPGRFQDPPKIAELLNSPADALESKFRSTYTNLLNLLDAFGSFEQVREIAEKSFAFRETAKTVNKLKEKRSRILKDLNAAVGTEAVDDLLGFERLGEAKRRLAEKIPETRAEMRYQWLRKEVTPGRIVARGKGSKAFALVLNVFGDKVVTMRDDGRGSSISLSKIGRVYAKRYPLDEGSVIKAFSDIHEGKNPLIREPKLTFQRAEEPETVELITLLMTDLSSAETGDSREPLFWENAPAAAEYEAVGLDIMNLREGIWEPFLQRARVLDYFGYLDFAGQEVTEQGKWLADLRLDRPLLVGEAIKEKIFEKADPHLIAGFMAAIAADPDRDYGKLSPSSKLLALLTDFEDVIYDVANVEWEFGVEPVDEINLSAAATAESWAAFSGWESLARNTGAEEGDLVRLLSRTGEALMQIAHLREPNAASASVAREAAEIVLRDPIR